MFDPKDMTVREMKKWASENLSVDIASNITGRDICIAKIEEVIDIKEKEYSKEATRVKSHKPFANEDKMKVKFTFPESPGCALTFDYEGFDAELRDGRVYELPMSVVKHLNSRVQPIYEPVAEEGQVCRKVGERNRFACIPV
jgi:hypothetical protein